MPVLVHASNRLEHLADRLLTQLAEELQVDAPGGLFTSALVLVPTAGLRDWLRQAIAARFGICAGIEFCFPGRLPAVLDQRLGRAPAASWDPERATWLGLDLLHGEAELAAAANEETPGRRSWALTRAVIDTFDGYARYRPAETLAAWAHGEPGAYPDTPAWQPRFWRRLLRAGCADPVAEHRERLAAIATGTGLPARIHAFGFNSLAPQLLELLAALGQRCEVVVASLQPTWGYWGEDQRHLRELVRAGVPSTDWGNRLLGDWGGVGRDFLRALDQIDAAYLADPADFSDPERDSLLHRLQSDLAAAADPAQGTSLPLADGDRSLTGHACHDLRRQLEVAKAAIHQALLDLPDLQLHEIALMTPDPTTVLPMAAAVFAGDGHGPPIAVGVADRTPRLLNPAADVLLRLLRLLAGRCTAGDVLDFVGTDAVAAAWGLGADELDRLRRWIDTADLRWGVDAAHRRDAVGHAFSAGSWRRGLQALQLAWWYGADTATARTFGGDADPAEAVAPVAGFQPEDFDTLKRLSLLLLPLFDSAAAMRQVQTPVWWRDRLGSLLQGVLRRHDDDADLAEVLALLADWCEQLPQQEADTQLSAAVIEAWLDERLLQPRGGDYARGAVTLSGMQPMRCLPFRMLCLVAMDDGAFPREGRRHDFDLLRRHPRPGDRDLRAEDRYLLLELLVTVRDRLCIAWQGFDERDQEPLPPAAMVGELLAQAALICGCSAAEIETRLVTQHRLHASDAADGAWPSPLIAAECAARQGRRQAPGFAPVVLPPSLEERLAIEDLVAFWRCPARAWLRRLGVHLADETEAPRDHERFAAPLGLDRYQAAQRLLGAEAGPADEAVLRRRLAAEAWLPPGAFGTYAWHRLQGWVGRLLAKQEQLRGVAQPYTVRLQVAGLELLGELPLVHPVQGVVLLQPAQLRAPRRLDLWFRALLAAAAGLPPRARLYHLGREGELQEYAVSITGSALDQLTVLVQAWRQGQQDLLPFAPDTSFRYAQQRWVARRPCGHGPALAQARGTWTGAAAAGRKAAPAEAGLPAHRLVWPAPSAPTDHADFARWAELVWQPILAAAVE